MFSALSGILEKIIYDQELEKKYYYRLVATKIQRCRKAFGLKPWNNINVFYDGVPTFPLDTKDAQEQIYQITNVNLSCFEGNVEHFVGICRRNFKQPCSALFVNEIVTVGIDFINKAFFNQFETMVGFVHLEFRFLCTG